MGSRDLKGQWYVLNYWGTWCYACRSEHPTLLQAQRDGRVQIIGVDWVAGNQDENADALEWLSKLGNPYSQVLTDHDGRTAIDLGVAGAPESFLVNPQGVIVYKEPGVITPEIWRREFLARLPPQSSAPAMKTLIAGAIVLITVLALAPARLAWAVDPATMSDPLLQARYQVLIHELRCVQCEEQFPRRFGRLDCRRSAAPDPRHACGRQIRPGDQGLPGLALQ